MPFASESRKTHTHYFNRVSLKPFTNGSSIAREKESCIKEELIIDNLHSLKIKGRIICLVNESYRMLDLIEGQGSASV